jgi:hypothetical protein
MRLHSLVTLACLLPSVALAWPVERVMELSPGDPTFLKIGSLSFLDVENPSIATAEVLPTGEVMLLGLAPGQTLLMFHAEGRATFFRLRVAGAENTRAPSGSPKECPGLKARSEAGRRTLEGAVSSNACRLALRALLQSDDYLAPALELTFDLATLQEQLKDMSAGVARVAPRVSLSYLGAALVMRGAATEGEHKAALWEIFKRAVGRVALNDQVALEMDAGTP